VTAAAYAEHLEAHLDDLPARLRSGRYVAPPVQRIWIEKADGGQRPIGLPTCEDTLVQRAVAMRLGAIDEQDVHDCSYGFRDGRSPHQARQELREPCLEKHIRWMVAADVSGCFDSLDHGRLRDVLRKRVKDGGLLRRLGKWRHAGVVEGDWLTYPEQGTRKAGSGLLLQSCRLFFLPL